MYNYLDFAVHSCLLTKMLYCDLQETHFWVSYYEMFYVEVINVKISSITNYTVSNM